MSENNLSDRLHVILNVQCFKDVLSVKQLCDIDAAASIVKSLECAPVAYMDTREALGLCAPTEADFPALYALAGKRVAIVELV